MSIWDYQLQVRHFTSSWNCFSSAAQHCRSVILHPFVHGASHGTFCSGKKTWLVLHFHPNWRTGKLEAITAVRFAQSTKVTSTQFIRESDYIKIVFDHFDTRRATLIWLVVLINQPNSANLKLSLCIFLFRSFLEREPLEAEERYFPPPMFVEESLWAKICGALWQTIERSYLDLPWKLYSQFRCSTFKFGASHGLASLPKSNYDETGKCYITQPYNHPRCNMI